jgi:malate synthase
MTKFYVDAQGRYLGGFDGATPPNGATEVATPPAHGADLWQNGAWVPDPTRLTEQSRHDADAAEAAAVKADAQVQTFLNFTPAQLDAWVDNNIGTAATLAELKTRCSTAFKVLGRIALAGGRGRKLR